MGVSILTLTVVSPGLFLALRGAHSVAGMVVKSEEASGRIELLIDGSPMRRYLGEGKLRRASWRADILPRIICDSDGV